jgi:hypothetical protein
MLRVLPRGLAIDPDVMKEFLDPPTNIGEWFARRAYNAAAIAMEADKAVTYDEYQQLQDLFNTATGALQEWTQRRQVNGKISTVMQRSGAAAYRAIDAIADTAKEVAAKADQRTAATMHDFTVALWSYFGCMALESDAAAADVPVLDVLYHYNGLILHPWQSAMTPQNLTRTWTPPKTELTTTTDDWGGTEPGQDPPDLDPPDDGGDTGR